MAKPIVIVPPPASSLTRAPTSPLPVNASPNVNPYMPGTWKRAPVGATFQGLGATMAEGSMSVSDVVRAKRDSYLTSDGFQISGPNYTQTIRKDAAGQLYIAPPSMPTAGYAARFYPYPSNKMRVGAALAGTPVRGGSIPAWLKGSKYYIPESPAEHRKAQMATLMGLGGGEFVDSTKYAYADSDWFKNTIPGEKRPDNMGRSCYRSVSDDPDFNQTFASECTLSPIAAAEWAANCDRTYPGTDAVSQDLRRRCKIVPTYLPAPPWSVAGKNQRGISDDLLKAYQALRDAAGKLPGGGGGGTSNPPLDCTKTPNDPLCKPREESDTSMVWPILAVAGAAAIVLAMRAK